MSRKSSDYILNVEDDDDLVMEECPDGTLRVIDGTEGSEDSTGFLNIPHFANLVPYLSENVLDSLIADIESGRQSDMLSMENWRSTLSDGIAQMDLKYESRDDPFYGACGVKNSYMYQAALSFASDVTSELLPSGGICRAELVVPDTDSRIKKATKIENFSNFYFTELYQDFFEEKERLAIWCYLAGSVFTKVYFDEVRQMVVSELVEPEDFIISDSVTSLESASRIIQRFRLSDKEIKLRQLNGVYFVPDGELVDGGYDDGNGQQSDISQEVENSTGLSKVPKSSSLDKSYELYEAYVDLDLEGFEHLDEDGNPTGLPVPYCVTYNALTLTPYAIYRNFNEGDCSFKRKNDYVHYRFLPGLKFLGIGAAQLFSGVSKEINNLTRMLVDGSQLYSFPGLLIADTMKLPDNNIRLSPLTAQKVTTVAGGAVADQMASIPFKEPSQLLYTLKNDFGQSILDLANAANTKLENFPTHLSEMSVLAIIEKSTRPQSAVLRRWHWSLSREFSLFYDLFPSYVEGRSFRDVGPCRGVRPDDFSDEFVIVPVSGPNITSKTQRLIEADTLFKLAIQNPDLHDMRNVYERIYRTIPIEDIEDILLPLAKPIFSDAMYENSMFLAGSDIDVAKEQDHNAHKQVHQKFVDDIKQGILEGSYPQVDLSKMLLHIAKHESFESLVQIEKKLNHPINIEPMDIPIEIQNAMTRIQADNVIVLLNKAKESAPPPPLDPSMVLLEGTKVKRFDVESRNKIEEKEQEIALLDLKVREATASEEREDLLKQREAKFLLEEKKLELDKAKMELDFIIQQKKIEMQDKKLKK